MKKGEYVIVTSEEYSDYGIIAFCQVEKDFEPVECASKFKDTHPDNTWSDTDFGDFLIKSGLLKKLPCKELHTGCYGRTDPKVSDL